MKHQMVYCNGKPGQYVCRCQCGQEFKSEWLSDLLFAHQQHRKKALLITNENVISIFTKRPLLV